MGYVYLLQPAELVGTCRYKIGISSKDNLNRLRSYGCGTRYIFFLECEDFFGVERSLKREFGMEKKIRLIKGKEYFEGDEKTILKIFMRVMWREKLAEMADMKPYRESGRISNITDIKIEDVEMEDVESDTAGPDDSIISFGKSINKFKFRQ